MQPLNTKTLFTISSSFGSLLFFVILGHFGYLNNGKQQMPLLNRLAKFWKILQINPYLWLNNNDTITYVGLGCESVSIDQGRSYIDININISNCFFSRYSQYDGDGGVIYVNGGDYSMNINYTMFNNCVSSSWGGGIYFSSSNSCIRMLCANKCSAFSFHFAFLKASQMNQVEYLSVSNCSHTTSGYDPICLFTGNQGFDNSNSSMNNAIQGSGIHASSASSYTSSYCTFSNNKVSNSRCIYLYSDSGTISMSFTNIVHNNSPSLGVITVEGAGLRKMMY